MAEFRQTALSIRWLAPGLATIYFWVVALSSFLAPRPGDSSTSPSPPPTDCSRDKLYNTMMAWIRWMALLMAATELMMYYVRKVTETEAEAKGNIVEEEAYKIVCEELKEAIKAVQTALADYSSPVQAESQSASDAKLDAYVTAIGRKNVATKKADRAKPKQGLARLPRARQIRVRKAFVSAIVFSFGAAFCASVSLYFSLRLQAGCDDGPAEILPFVMVGLLCVGVHVEALKVAMFKD